MVDCYIGDVKIIGVLSNQVPIDTVVQHWLLATNGDRITVGLPLNLYPSSKVDYPLHIVIGVKSNRRLQSFREFTANMTIY